MLRLLIALPFLVVLVVFALSNRATVTLGMLYYETEMPLAVAILGASAFFFLIGGLMVWFGELKQRRRARRAEQRVLVLEEQLAAVRLQAALPEDGVVAGSRATATALRLS